MLGISKNYSNLIFKTFKKTYITYSASSSVWLYLAMDWVQRLINVGMFSSATIPYHYHCSELYIVATVFSLQQVFVIMFIFCGKILLESIRIFFSWAKIQILIWILKSFTKLWNCSQKSFFSVAKELMQCAKNRNEK